MTYFDPQALLEFTTPTARAAYSDRTAWLMAHLSKLAYLQFEGDLDLLLCETAQELTLLQDEKKIKKKLHHFIDKRLEQAANGKKSLEEALAIAGFKLEATFNCNGTQAFLAVRNSDKMAVLSFRGTESTQKQDILADLNVFLVNSDNIKIHSGFRKAFNCVKTDIQDALKKLPNHTLYITGHSLGGALALIATRELETDQTAACYTFGSPRVGNDEFSDRIKTPIYRVVNTADIVPRMPPGLAIELVVDALRFFKYIIPWLECIASWLDNRVSGYRHHGDMRYLTYTKQEDASDVQIIYNITFAARWRRLIKNRVSLNNHISDHGIDKYCHKLGAYALKRSQK